MMGRPAAGRDPDEDERQQELANEAEKGLDRSRRLFRLSWWANQAVFVLARPRRLYDPPPKRVLLPRHERHV